MPNTIVRELKIRKETAREITVWLGKEDSGASFNCIYCKKTQFHHKQRIISLLDGLVDNILKSPPISIQCNKCGCIYHIQGML